VTLTVPIHLSYCTLVRGFWSTVSQHDLEFVYFPGLTNVLALLIISKREVKRVRHDNVDAQFSDVSGEGHGTDDVAADGDFRGQMERTPSPTNNDTMENQVCALFQFNHSCFTKWECFLYFLGLVWTSPICVWLCFTHCGVMLFQAE
jgi:hypothetical protein